MEEYKFLTYNIGKLNPTSATEYATVGGYTGLKIALANPSGVIQIVKDSNLRGRGGAGFPTGMKWSFVRNTDADQKYIVCNADEGEPGTNKDRILMAGVPHLLFEGMAIAGVAVGATKGYIYLRAGLRLPTYSTGSCSPASMRATCCANAASTNLGDCPGPTWLKGRIRITGIP